MCVCVYICKYMYIHITCVYPVYSTEVGGSESSRQLIDEARQTREGPLIRSFQSVMIANMVHFDVCHFRKYT